MYACFTSRKKMKKALVFHHLLPNWLSSGLRSDKPSWNAGACPSLLARWRCWGSRTPPRISVLRSHGLWTSCRTSLCFPIMEENGTISFPTDIALGNPPLRLILKRTRKYKENAQVPFPEIIPLSLMPSQKRQQKQGGKGAASRSKR